MKILDAAHIQALELSNSGYQYTGRKSEFNHVFLTPTFSQYEPDTYTGKAANDAIKRFTDNLTKNYGATSYVWVKEFTKYKRYLDPTDFKSEIDIERIGEGVVVGGVPHYHMLVTMPYCPVGKLNAAWCKARRGDFVKNALRTGWDAKRKKPVMLIRNYRQAVGYAAKYIGKSQGGDICVFKTSCKKATRKTWEFSEGHSTKCYGMSQNLQSKPKEIDPWMEFHFQTHIDFRRHKTENSHAEFFFIDNPQQAESFYQNVKGIELTRPKKIEKITPKKPNYSITDQTRIEFYQSVLSNSTK